MRVLQANKYHYVKGGAERYYLDVSHELADRGHTVIPFAMHHARNEPTSHDRYFVSEIDYHSHLNVVQKLHAAGRSIYSLETVRRVTDLVRNERPEVAHLHNIYHQISPSLLTALSRLGVPMVHTLHDYKVVCPGYLFLAEGKICEVCDGGHYYHAVGRRCLLESRTASFVGFLEATLHQWLRTYQKVDFFLCPSRFMLEKVAEHGLPREKLIHFPYFLSLESYEPSYERSDYFIFLGRLSREKGVATLLNALRRRGSRKLRCRILGEGPLEASLKAKAAQWNLRNVEFAGYLQGEDLHEAIRSAAFTVVPSEWYENLPFSVLESFALGTPVVGARIGGIPEMVLHERTGLTFTSGDSLELADALDWMESRPAAAVEMGRAARKLVEERYAPQPHLERLEQLYKRVAR